MAKGQGKDYYCTAVSENVEITLKRKRTSIFESKGQLFVQCNQSECQYVDVNEYPCPLDLNLFADKIARLAEKVSDRED